jgi:hypothetical protein
MARVVFHLSPAAFNFTLDAAAAANYSRCFTRNSSGTYNFLKALRVLLLRYRQRFSSRNGIAWVRVFIWYHSD